MPMLFYPDVQCSVFLIEWNGRLIPCYDPIARMSGGASERERRSTVIAENGFPQPGENDAQTAGIMFESRVEHAVHESLNRHPWLSLIYYC